MKDMKPNDPQGKNQQRPGGATGGGTGGAGGTNKPGMQDKNRQQPNQPWGTDTKK